MTTEQRLEKLEREIRWMTAFGQETLFDHGVLSNR